MKTIERNSITKIESKNKEDEAKISDYFHLGSNTKAITGFICAYFVEQNKKNMASKIFLIVSVFIALNRLLIYRQVLR